MKSLYHDRLSAALKAIDGLTSSDITQVSALDFTLVDCVVIGYLRSAGHLLSHDCSLDALDCHKQWTSWYQGAHNAVEAAMRYQQNEPLLVAISVVKALYPAIYPAATLRGFKRLDDLIIDARREMTIFKRERRRRTYRVNELITPTNLWSSPANTSGSIYRSQNLTPEEIKRLKELGYEETWGLHLSYTYCERVMTYVKGVLPTAWQPAENGALIVPLHHSAPSKQGTGQ